jgi:two-component system chemotaxis response regulator CheY
LDHNKFQNLRVLLLGGKRFSMTLLKSALRIAGINTVIQAENSRHALDRLSLEHFDAVFCDRAVEAVGGLSFPAAVRANVDVLNPMIPVFEFYERACRSDVERSRDSGVTDVLVCPISPKTLITKLNEALVRPRSFIAAPNFFGPDRRTSRHRFGGHDRRVRKPKKVVVDFRTTNLTPV